jgi:hypothetical protein
MSIINSASRWNPDKDNKLDVTVASADALLVPAKWTSAVKLPIRL